MTTTKTLAALVAILALAACGGRGQKKSAEAAASESRSEHDNGRSGNSNNGYPDGYFDTIPVLLDTRLTKDFERFDREFYDRYYDGRFKRVVKTLADGTELNMSAYGGAPVQYMWSPGSYFTLFKQFYWRNGNIHLKGLQWNFRKGIWYEFDMDGNLTGQTDYDAPYAFTREDVLEFCRQNDIEVKRYRSGVYEPTHIRRDIENGEPRWYISYESKEMPGAYEIITLDGKTGEVLDKITAHPE